MTQIIPAILAISEESYQEQVERVNSIAGDVDGWVHIDFADGILVPSKTIDLEMIAKYPVNLKKEAHLMIKNPSSMLWRLIDLEFKRIIVHVESEDVASNLAFIEDHEIETGLAINYDTPLEIVKPYLNDLDVIVMMGIKSGLQGQEFISGVIEKITQAKSYNLVIEIDGGITPENARMIADAGADRLIIGSHLLNGDVKQNLEQFRQVLG